MSKPGDHRKERSRPSILAIALAIFLQNGFSGTSMSAVSSALGGSKGTLWGHFPSKLHLFFAVIAKEVSCFDAALSALSVEGAALEEIVRNVGRVWLGCVVADDSLRLQRIILGLADRIPEFAELCLESGRGRVERVLETYLHPAVQAGLLRDCDTRRAARQFLGLCQANSYSSRILNAEQAPDQPTRDGDVDEAVDAFMRAFGRDAPSLSAPASG